MLIREVSITTTYTVTLRDVKVTPQQLEALAMCADAFEVSTAQTKKRDLKKGIAWLQNNAKKEQAQEVRYSINTLNY